MPRNTAALRYAARSLQSPYTLPAGPDTTAISASARRVFIGTPVTITATVDDSRFNQNNGTETVQTIASARAYLDVAPWTIGASARAMQAVDGSFNTSREQVRVTIPTTGMQPGRHVVYVQGVDAGGRAGTPQAVYFTALRPWRAME